MVFLAGHFKNLGRMHTGPRDFILYVILADAALMGGVVLLESMSAAGRVRVRKKNAAMMERVG